ncbi:MAG: hypothetical protein JWQ85_1306 [Mucilaginibacter sp.]|nr:hypothetical protein [Mucilaginibacter sp.]
MKKTMSSGMIMTLADVFPLIRNGASIKQDDTQGGIPITRIETIADGTIDNSRLGFADIDTEKYATYYLQDGDILMSHINSWAHLGKTALAENIKAKIIHGMNLLVLRPNINELFPRYGKYFFETPLFKNQLYKISNQSVNQSSFAISKLRSLQIPVPKLRDQQYIADILDKADTLRKKDQQLLQYYDDLAQNLFIDMFGNPVRNEKGWPQKSLSSACVKITDGTHFSPPSQASGVPYITAKHVRKNKVDFFNNPTYVTQEDHEAIYSRCTPVKGDVLYIKDGATTGIAAINNYDFEFSMLSSLALIKVNKQVLNNYFLAHWLNNENIKENYIRNYMAGAAIRRFTLDKIKRFEILIPPITLQNKFATQIQNIEQQKEKLKLQMQESENLFQSLLQKAFNGDLN